MKNNMIAQWGGDAKDTGSFFREITGIRQQDLTSRTIRDRKGIDLDTRRQINQLFRQVIQMAEEISLLTSTIQHQLPPTPSNTRKSQKQVGRFGALTTKDAKRLTGTRNTKDNAASIRKGRKMAPPS
ncbi:hypothetical protein V1506DRAFT_124350 [Lipomyces tetrasporus]